MLIYGQTRSHPAPPARDTGVVPVPSLATKKPQWPLAVQIAVRLVAKDRQPEDRGVGDTLARRLGGVGESFKTWFAAVFRRDCGCGGRQTWLNRNFPYPLPWE